MTPRSFFQFIWAAGLASLLGALAPGAYAQKAYPTKPIKLVVPFAVGGVTDTSARLIADQLSRRLGQQVVVENKPGASGNIGTHQVMLSEPDGYTLLMGFDGTLAINPSVFDKLPFDPVQDFAPIGKIGDAALILVASPEFPGKTLADVVSLSKSKPGGLSYGTSGNGGTPHIAGEIFKQRTGANLVHIPYKGGGQAIADALGNNVPLVYTAIAGALPHVKSGKLQAIAVSSASRAKSLPNVPTFAESGYPNFEINSWVGLLVPKKTPSAIVERLNAELNTVLNDAEVKEKLEVLGIAATPGTPSKFGDEIRRDIARYRAVVKSAGIKLE
ncbi:MAG: tripartite tricarboxylate transporter substrate binding protein [Betaproteobacteria bacterium]|nr:tripartite tricarboxylate transporter substrate binding protein [Betaproteobacteria bacterium]NBT74622.1 tripartite tricarboxylate transporter substrate binding protein [Betaproteobacteria bacterium]NBY13912.1 tripartite tricarboxylate transporter substrate binding protein [Betaproteobacteria bacterium]NCA15907.1 tripartite tricarboxylate transporter substrate binding protein [Betaproteobacteria bacterium]